jgi:hypothetical protein
MRTLKLALAAGAIALTATANAAPVNGMGLPPDGWYQPVLPNLSGSGSIDGLAFHAGGVAACDGCHVMHNAGPGPGAKSTIGGLGQPAWSNHTNAYLLQGSDQSSTCLLCHGNVATQSPDAQHQFYVADLDLTQTFPRNFTPAGDFGWLSKTFTGIANGTTPAAVSAGQIHGHNVIARDFAANGFVADTRFTGVAPGGTFPVLGGSPTSNFACSSCHDPHGRYRMQAGTTGPNGVDFAGGPPGTYSTNSLPIVASGSYGDIPGASNSAVPAGVAVGTYRLLAGRNYEPASKTGYPFTSDPPTAVAPKTYNKDEATTETRVMYGTGMSEWCKNCHVQIHMEGYVPGAGGQRHPAASTATLRDAQVQVYNTYISSGNSNPALTANYTSLVPFEQGAAISLNTLKPMAVAGAASGNVQATITNNVMCLSCHRAHASAFDSMVRWDQNATFLTGNNAFTGGIVNRDLTVTAAGYYNRTPASLGNYQRSLCNKCHGKD